MSLVGQHPWPAVYGDYESRWTAMLTGEGSLTLGVSALTPPLLLLSFTCLQSAQQQEVYVFVFVCVRENERERVGTAGRKGTSHKQLKAI